VNRDDKTGWRPRRVLSTQDAMGLATRAFPRDRVVEAEPLVGGLRNTTIRVVLGTRGRAVLRLYDADPSACAKEGSLLTSLASSVPVPELLDARPEPSDGLPPLLLLRYVEGIPFRDLKNTHDLEAIAQAAASIGACLAAIGAHHYPHPGRLEADGRVGTPFVAGPDPFLQFLDQVVAAPAFQARVSSATCSRIGAHARAWASRLRDLEDEAHLVHGDFGATNILVRRERGAWQVAAVLDWEFALSGSPMFDLGHFLRYERASRPLREPAFSRGYRDAGGVLPDDWRQLARAVDLTALCELLTREDVPPDVVAEVAGMVEATLDGRDPP
jgi:Ser/Thr protein kinase RdoA (MazF antagonist)